MRQRSCQDRRAYHSCCSADSGRSYIFFALGPLNRKGGTHRGARVHPRAPCRKVQGLRTETRWAAARSAAWRPSHGFRRVARRGEVGPHVVIFSNFAQELASWPFCMQNSKKARQEVRHRHDPSFSYLTPSPLPARPRSRPGPAGLERSTQRDREELVLRIPDGLIARVLAPVPGPVGL